jgi:HK97 family phage prohead protease
MTAVLTSRADAAVLRAAAAGAAGPDAAARSRREAPVSSARSGLAFPAQMRAGELVERNGKSLRQLLGYASIFERKYEMWDLFGPYDEVVDLHAGDKTLAADPDVAFLLNHRGMTMARTRNDTLDLSVDPLGLRSEAFVNPDRTDVRDMTIAIDDGDITEMSFAFMLVDGEWSEDWTTYRILEFDIDRGDVSAVNYGANPYTSIAARSREIVREMDALPVGAARAALAHLQSRDDLAGDKPVPLPPAPVPAAVRASGMSVDELGAQLALLEQQTRRRAR